MPELKRKHISFCRRTLSKLVVLLLALASLAAAAAESFATPPSTFVYPLVGTRISSKFGMRKHPVRRITKHHGGIDLAAPASAPIRSIAEGVVIFADPYKGYGNLIVVRHPDGMTSHYGHLEQIKVTPGKRVKAGQIVGTVGQTGMVTGPHLHFEVRIEGKPQDPEKFIRGLALEAEG